MGTAPVVGSGTSSVLANVLHALPDVRESLDAAWAVAWQAVDPCLLELARLRVAMLLGCAAEQTFRSPEARAANFNEQQAEQLASWPTSGLFGPVERACLAYTEEFIFDVANLRETTAADVRLHLGEAGLADFTTALLIVEQRQRLRVAWEKLFASNQEETAHGQAREG